MKSVIAVPQVLVEADGSPLDEAAINELAAVRVRQQQLDHHLRSLVVALAETGMPDVSFRVDEVPIHMRPRAGGVPSTRRFRLVVNYLRLLIGILGSASRRARLRKDEA